MKVMIDSEHVSSVQQFVKVVSNQSRAWQKNTWDERTESSWLPWFRGEEQANWPTALKPKLYRTKYKLKEVLRQEQDLRLEFRRRGSQFIGDGRPTDHWEWYFLMQHYGVPTRLLDWSDGALVALYFALKPISDEKGSRQDDAAVYMLDPWWLNNTTTASLRIPTRRIWRQ